MTRRGCAWLLVGLAMALAVSGGAMAHTSLVAAKPAPGSRTVGSPAELRLTFDAPLQPGSTLWLYAEAFRRVQGVEPRIDGAQLIAPLPAPLTPAAYTVQWSAVGADGHTTEGSFGFYVQAPPAVPWTAILVAGLAVASAGLFWIVARKR